MTIAKTFIQKVHIKLRVLKHLIEDFVSKETVAAIFMTIMMIIVIFSLFENDTKLLIEVLKIMASALGVILTSVSLL